MKKILLSFVLLLTSTVFMFGAPATTWQSLDLTKAAGGTISPDINMMAIDGGKLYVATNNDGIWVSPSANGGDFEPFGLQGIRVTHLSFKVLKLAVVTVTATDDGTKVANKLYKYNGTSWDLTNLNPDTFAAFGGPSANFDQIQDGSDNTVIVVPTWGNGIWRSTDGGANFTQYAYGTNDDGDVYKTVTGIWAYGNKLYGTDKVTTNATYMLTSTDYGATWTNVFAGGTFFNPRSFHARKVGTTDFVYIGGDSDNNATGSINYTDDPTFGFSSSLAIGSDYWFTNKIIGDDDGPLYISCSKTNVMVSTDNGDSFAPLSTGIGIIANPPKGYISDLVKSATKLYASTRTVNGIYYYALATGVESAKENNLSVSTNASKTELLVNTAIGSKISIYELSGKMLLSAVSTSANERINISNLNSSVFIIKAVQADGKILVNKFVK